MRKFLIIITITGALLLNPIQIFSETTSPGDPGGNPQTGGDPPLGGGAPIGSGTLILMALGTAYGGKKIYKLKKDKENEDND